MNGELIKMDNVHSSFGDIEPLPDTLSPVEKFDYRLLPDGAFAEHIRDISERMQCSPDFVAVAMMTTLGSIIGRSHQIRPKQFDDWIVVPNLWGVVIASPSQLKSPAVEASLSHVKRLDIESKEQFDEEMKTYECDKDFKKLERDHTKKEALKLLNGKKPDEARALLESQEDVEPPIRRRRYTNDSTIEKLGELLVQNPNGMLVYRDEIHGFLKTIDSESRPNDRAFYLEGWNGTGSYQSDRIGRGTTDIKHHVISLFGTIQPGRFASYIHNALRQGSGDDGFSQRFQLAVYPDERGKWENVDRHPNNDAKNAVYATIQQLAEMAETNEPVILQFTPEAQAVFNEWRNDLENNKLLNNDDHPALITHLAKYRSLLPSLALIIHLVDTCDAEVSPVSEMAIIKACGWCDYLESHARRIYTDATNNPLKTAKLILSKIQSDKLPNGFNRREIIRKGWAGLTDTAEIKEGIETLIDEGYLLECVIETSTKPAVTYRIHPKIMEGVANG
jgi:putative DNA primase/helicase